MNGIVYDLGHYYAKLDEVFSPSHMTEVARNAAIRDFTLHVQKHHLSIGEAIAELNDAEKTRKFISVGQMVDGYVVEEGSVEQSPSASSAEIISVLQEDVNFIKDAVSNFIAVGQKTNEVLLGVEQAVKATSSTAEESKKVLGAVHSAAGELKQNLRHAIDTTRDIVQRLDTFPARLDVQIHKLEVLEKGIDEATKEAKGAKGAAAQAADNTHPPKTHEENIKMMWQSVMWSTVFGTIAGTGFGMLTSHLAATPPVECKDTETRIETKIIEKVPALPESVILRNKSEKKVYILEVGPVSKQEGANTVKSLSEGVSRPKAVQSPKQAAKPASSAPN